MGCCLTKKSRENKSKKSTTEPLMGIQSVSSERGLSLTKDVGYGNKPSIDSAYSPPSISSPTSLNDEGVQQFRKEIVGKSLLQIPSINSLTRTGWMYKRGHLVSHFTSFLSHFILLHFIYR